MFLNLDLNVILSCYLLGGVISVKKFVIRLDDIAPNMNWGRMMEIEKYFVERDIKPLIGVVPDNQDPNLLKHEYNNEFWGKVRYWKSIGWTVAQHGFQHLYCNKNAGILGISHNSEFAGVGYSEQYLKIKKGKEILESNGVWQPVFMAPSHSFDAATLRALRNCGFLYVTDGYGLWPYERNGLVFVPQLFSGFMNLGIGVYTVCAHINSMSHVDFDRFKCETDKMLSKVVAFSEVTDLRGTSRFLDRIVEHMLNNGIRATRALRRSRL